MLDGFSSLTEAFAMSHPKQPDPELSSAQLRANRAMEPDASKGLVRMQSNRGHRQDSVPPALEAQQLTIGKNTQQSRHDDGEQLPTVADMFGGTRSASRQTVDGHMSLIPVLLACVFLAMIALVFVRRRRFLRKALRVAVGKTGARDLEAGLHGR